MREPTQDDADEATRRARAIFKLLSSVAMPPDPYTVTALISVAATLCVDRVTREQWLAACDSNFETQAERLRELS